ncbi:MAG: M3 family metallopeptidase [Lachnospiraceae bacterium]|nr:M3 family metallopeptidase [Lachnospiraceae bacterium]
MKKRILSLVLLLTLLLTSCGLLGGASSVEPVPYDSIQYARPDLDAYRKAAEAAVKEIGDGAGYLKTVKLLNEEFERYYDAYTMNFYASNRYSQVMNDSFFEEESLWHAENQPVYDELHERVLIAAAKSEHCEMLEDSFFQYPGFLTDLLAHPRYTNEEYLALTQEENRLTEEYRALLADPVIDWNGKELHIETLGEDETISEDEFSDIFRAYYEKYNALAGEIFLKLMQVRADKAKAVGYGSYTELAGAELGRTVSYETVRAYLDSLAAAFVPLADEIYGAELEVEPYPDLGVEETEAFFEKICEKLGDPFVGIRDIMVKNGLLDIKPSVNKEDMSYSIYFPSVYTPFIFINPTETYYDLPTLLHEFGHFCDMYVNFGGAGDIDLSECYSVSLELLSSLWTEGILDEENAEICRVNALLDAVDTMVYQGLYADFETSVYLNEDVDTVEELNEAFRAVSVKWGAITEDDDSYYPLMWFEVPHLFLYPTYVPSYCLATECALQLLSMEYENENAGLDAYITFLYREENVDSLERAVADAGIHSPLNVGASQNSADLIRKMLGLNG